MSYSISTLLTRNLHEVFGENDPARRRAAIDEIFNEDCVFYDPNGGVYGCASREESPTRAWCGRYFDYFGPERRRTDGRVSQPGAATSGNF